MTSDDRNKSQPYSIPRVIDLRAYNSQIEQTSDQFDPSYFDVARYLPPGIHVKLVEKGGALFVPHRLNEFAIKVVRKKVDLVVFQCMIRYTLGFHRPVARLSNGFIGTWTGLQTPNVRKGIRSLKEMGLVKILVPGTASSTALYDVPIVRGYLDWRREREIEAKRGATNQDEIQTILDTDNPRPVRTGFSGIPEQEQIKSGPDSARSPRKKSERKENLSPLENLPHRITNFIATIRPHQKRVEEEYHLHQLLRACPSFS